MKYILQSKVAPDVAARHQEEIERVNAYVDGLHGTVITVKMIRAGQPRPYADAYYEAEIACHQPNSLTTGAPLLRTISRDEAKTLARIFVHEFYDNPGSLGDRLDSLTPTPNPWGLKEPSNLALSKDRASCWHVIICSPCTD